MKKKIQDMDVQGKTVLLRCDFNVPVKDGKILDDSTFMPQTLKIEDQRTQNFLDKADIVNKNEITEIYEDMDSYENSLMFESHEFRTIMDIIRFVIKFYRNL